MPDKEVTRSAGSDRPTLEQLLEQRHTIMLEWEDPCKACGPEGNPLDAHVTHRASVHDCVNMMREVARRVGRATRGQDLDFLTDFLAMHWAEVKTNEEKL